MGELVRPLGAQRGGDEDQRPPRRTTVEQFSDDETRLDGLAEPHVVGEKHARTEPTNHGKHRLELMRDEVDAASTGTAEHPWMLRCGKKGAPVPAPFLRTDPTQRAHAINPFHVIEGRNHTLGARSVVRAGTFQRNQGAWSLILNVDHAPALASNAHVIPDARMVRIKLLVQRRICHVGRHDPLR
jgi:hypothetical protein